MRSGGVAGAWPLPSTAATTITAATSAATRMAAPGFSLTRTSLLSTSELDRLLGGGDETNRPEQAGGHERRVGREFADVGPRDPLLFRPGQVTDDAVGPEVGDTHHEAVPARSGRGGDVGAERRLPQDA